VAVAFRPRDNDISKRALRGPVAGLKNVYTSRSRHGTELAAMF
jgi:hypothetical protein